MRISTGFQCASFRVPTIALPKEAPSSCRYRYKSGLFSASCRACRLQRPSDQRQRLSMVSLLAVTTTTAVASTNALSHSQRGSGLYARFPPPLQHRFSTSTSTTDHDLSDTYLDDCPLCAKYGARPCGPLFRLWLGSTDNVAFAADKDPISTAWAADFDRLQTCL